MCFCYGYVGYKSHQNPAVLWISPLESLDTTSSQELHIQNSKFSMFYSVITSALCLASLATAHFSIEYPEWRGDSFATGASQYIYPCMTSMQSVLLNITNALRCQCQPDSIHKSDYLALDRWFSQPRPPPSMDLFLCQSWSWYWLSYFQHIPNSTAPQRDREWYSLSPTYSSSCGDECSGWSEREYPGCDFWTNWQCSL